MSRYDAMFADLQKKNQGAFIPFIVLLDPDRETSKEIMRTLIRSGADALELGLAYSDPVADGPTIQKADMRVLRNHGTVKAALALVAEIRQEFSEIPIGLLVYANIVFKSGLDHFYDMAARSGVDSVLVADVPIIEARPYIDAAIKHKIDPVLIAPPNLPQKRLSDIALLSKGYTYVVTRRGITGAKENLLLSHRDLLNGLKDHNAPPAVFGFGISTPEHVALAIKEGASGAISGSKIVSIIEENISDKPVMLKKLGEFVRDMKAATQK